VGRNKKFRQDQMARAEEIQAEQLLLDRIGAQQNRILGYAEAASGDLDEVVKLASADIRKAIDTARDLMAPWNAFDVLTWLRLQNLPLVDNYRESTHEGLLALVEMAALILLERDGPEATGPRLSAAGGDASNVANLSQSLSKELRSILEISMVKTFAEMADADTQDYVRWRVVEREVIIRNGGYPHIQTRHLEKSLDQKVPRALMEAHLGFDIRAALAAIAALDRRLDYQLQAAAYAAKAKMVNWVASEDPEILEIQALLGDRFEEFLRLYIAHEAGDRLGRRLTINHEELAELAGISLKASESFLKAFSLPFQRQVWDAEMAIAEYLGGLNPLRLRPLIDADDGAYLVVDVGRLLFSLREVLEKAIPERKRPDYARAVSGWMEDVAVEALTELLQPDQVIRNVEYFTNTGELVELDALLICDRVALTLEAKHVTFSAKARTGHGARLKRDLDRLVGDTMAQASRTKQTVLAEGGLRLRTGETIDLSHVKRIFPVAVTLEDTSTIAGTVKELIDSEFIEFHGPLPWVISLHDLMVVCDISEGAAQFLAYLDQHERLIGQGVLTVPEELDIFMMFLKTGERSAHDTPVGAIAD
jgi:hypothetical protein